MVNSRVRSSRRICSRAIVVLVGLSILIFVVTTVIIPGDHGERNGAGFSGDAGAGRRSCAIA